MADTTFTFRLDDELKAAFADTAKAQDRTAAQLLRVLMRDEVARSKDAQDHDAWFRAEVEEALREADDPNTQWIDDEEVRANWRKQRAELLKRAGGKAA